MLSPYEPSSETVKDKLDKKLIAELEAKGTLKYVTFGTALNFLLEYPNGSINVKSASWEDKQQKVEMEDVIGKYGLIDVLTIWTPLHALAADVWHPTPADMFRCDYIITKQ